MNLKRSDYDRRLENEISLYREEFLEKSTTGLIKIPKVWDLVEWVMARKIEASTGSSDGVAYVVSELDKRPNPKFLSLGAGACALETEWIIPAIREPHTCTLECMDVNPEIMSLGRKAAQTKGINFVPTVVDVNHVKLDAESYDIILAWAALHHFVELDHIAHEINKALKPDGLFITMDICSRNGFLLWPETEPVVDRLWQRLPKPYRFAHTLGPKPIYCDRYPNVDCSKGGFECIHSEDILPALRRHLEVVHFIPAHALARRFFDTMFGPNFDLGRDFDLRFFLDVMLTDEMAIANGTLPPETFFGAYRKRLHQ